MFIFASFIGLLSGLILSWFLRSLLISKRRYCIDLFLTFSITFSFSIVIISFIFIGTVLVVGNRVIFYSSGYIERDLNLIRFLILLCLFIFRIVILISSSSWRTLILGWDGLGLSSYFLVVFYNNPSSNSGGRITVFRNRVGDIFIILFILAIIRDISLMAPVSALLYCRIIIFLAAITKSAIFPYISWLPEAIAAPTPVSSLVHSSTLVTAGVFLLLQISNWLSLIRYKRLILVAFLSLIVSSIVAVSSRDLKKIVALSTLRQLRLIMVTLSIGLFSLTFFHLISHAIFKSCLFISVGGIIHLRGGRQEARLGFTNKVIFRGLSIIVLRVFCLRGAPFTSAYFTKESLFLSSLSIRTINLIIFILVLRALATIFYSLRIVHSVVRSIKYKFINLVDSFSIHIFTMGLILLRVILGEILRNKISISYNSSIIVLARLLIMIRITILLIQYRITPALKSKTIFNIINLKSISVFYLIYTLRASKMMKAKWELGRISNLFSINWVKISNRYRRKILFFGQRLFSNYLSILIVFILILIMLY